MYKRQATPLTLSLFRPATDNDNRDKNGARLWRNAGLECGLFLDKYPTLDMISFGPTLTGVHSPDAVSYTHLDVYKRQINKVISIVSTISINFVSAKIGFNEI